MRTNIWGKILELFTGSINDNRLTVCSPCDALRLTPSQFEDRVITLPAVSFQWLYRGAGAQYGKS